SATDVAGVYHASRRAESSLVRLNEFASQIVVKITGAGDLRLFPAIWPFGDGRLFKHVDGNLYEGPASSRIAFIKGDGAESYIAQPGIRLQRVPWWLDVRWMAPALALTAAVVLLTLLLWPVGALWRRWRKRRWGEGRSDRRKYLVVRLVLLVDAAVILMTAALFMASADLSIFNSALDPLLLALYALAWLGLFGAIPTSWAAIAFWRNGIGGRWSRIHHSLIAASS